MSTKERIISRIVVVPNVGLQISHSGPRDKKGTPSRVTEIISAEPSVEFTKSMKTLAAAVVKSTGIGSFEQALRSGQLEGVLDEKALESTIKKCLTYTGKQVTVTGVTIKYDEGNIVGVKVAAKYANHVGEVLAVNSPQIEIGGTNPYGWETTLLKNVQQILEETKSFLNGNYTQLAVEQEDPKEEAEEAEDIDLGDEEEDVLKRKVNLRISKKAA